MCIPLRSHGLQQARISCHSFSPRVCSQVHCVDDAIQPSHSLLSPSPPAISLTQNQGLCWWVSSSHQVAIILELQLQHQSFLWTFMVDFLVSGGLPSMGSHRVRHDWSDLAAAAAWLFPVLTLCMLVHWNSSPCVFHSSTSLKFFILKIMRNKNQELKSRD